jgi:3',5'-cyclic AMP phosphodiesterase CpdA
MASVVKSRWTTGLPRVCGITVLAIALAGCVHHPQTELAFVQMCDPQIGFGGHDADVARFQQAVQQINALHPKFVVICGDLVNAASEEAYAEFKILKSEFRVPCYCAPGNHDVGNAPTAASLARHRRCMGKDYFAFVERGCEFVVVNSQLWKAPVSGESEKQDRWLNQTLELAARRHRPIFVIDHYPLFVKTADEAEQYYNLPKGKRQELLELFVRCGVVAILSGHTHSTNIKDYEGIQMVASQTTSKNFDKQPFGFRVWYVGTQRPYRTEFVPLRQPDPEGENHK